MTRSRSIYPIVLIALVLTPQWVLAEMEWTSDTIRQSPLTPWIGGALALFILVGVIKIALHLMTRIISIVVIGALCYIGYHWWQDPSRPVSEIGQELVGKLRSSDFQSGDRLDSLLQDSRQWLADVTTRSQEQGTEATRRELSIVVEALEERIREASAKGSYDAVERYQTLRDDVIQKIQALPE